MKRTLIVSLALALTMGLFYSAARAQYPACGTGCCPPQGGLAAGAGVANPYGVVPASYHDPGMPLPMGHDGGGFDTWDGGPSGHHGGGPLWNRSHSPIRFWTALEYVGLWVEGQNVPPLVTTSPANTQQAAAGVLPAATVLFGGAPLDDDLRHGGELRLGWWLVDGQFLGVEGHYLRTEREASRFEEASMFPGGRILARPTISGNNESAYLVAFPTVFPSGSIRAETASDLQSAGVTLRHVMVANFEHSTRLDMIGGYRFFRLDDSVEVRDSRVNAQQVTTSHRDFWRAQNEFHGGEVGLRIEHFTGHWSLETLGKIALGNNFQRLDRDGSTTVGAAPPTAGGLLVSPDEIGRLSRDRFALLPEFQTRVNYDVTCHFRLTGGYRFLYLDEAIRSGEQINRDLTTTRNPDAVQRNDLWIHGMHFGAEFSY